MGQQSTSKTSADSDSQNTISYIEIPKELKPLLDYACGQYGSIMKKATRSDDAQEKFTSAGAGLVRGSELTAKIALMAASQLQADMI